MSKEIACLAETVLRRKQLRCFLGDYVDTREFAEIRGLAPQTIRLMLHDGKLPPQEVLPKNRRAWRTEVIEPYFSKR